MKLVIQRVSEAEVVVDKQKISKIRKRFFSFNRNNTYRH